MVDLSGWLIPNEKISEFKEVWQQFEEDDTWIEYYCFAEPEETADELIIVFKYY